MADTAVESLCHSRHLTDVITAHLWRHWAGQWWRLQQLLRTHWASAESADDSIVSTRERRRWTKGSEKYHRFDAV